MKFNYICALYVNTLQDEYKDFIDSFASHPLQILTFR